MADAAPRGRGGFGGRGRGRGRGPRRGGRKDEKEEWGEYARLMLGKGKGRSW